MSYAYNMRKKVLRKAKRKARSNRDWFEDFVNQRE